MHRTDVRKLRNSCHSTALAPQAALADNQTVVAASLTDSNGSVATVGRVFFFSPITGEERKKIQLFSPVKC